MVLDLLHDHFQMTTASLLHSSDKDLNDIQQIVTSTEVANLAKQAMKILTNLAIIAPKKELKKYPNKPRITKECFNCGKKNHYTKDCYALNLNKIKPKKSFKETKYGCWKKSQVKVVINKLIIDHDNSNIKSYLAGETFITYAVEVDDEKPEV